MVCFCSPNLHLCHLCAMDIHEIEEGCAILSLDEETGSLDAPGFEQGSSSVTYLELVGCFLTDRPIKFEHMQHVLASVWRPAMGMRVLPLNDNLVVFNFPIIETCNEYLTTVRGRLRIMCWCANKFHQDLVQKRWY